MFAPIFLRNNLRDIGHEFYENFYFTNLYDLVELVDLHKNKIGNIFDEKQVFDLPLTYLDFLKTDKQLIKKFVNDYRQYMKKAPRANFMWGKIRLFLDRK